MTIRKTTLALLAAGLTSATALPLPAAADDSSLLVRLRGIGVIPDEDSSVTPIGGSVNADNDFVPELDFSYFFTPNIALELILATTRHSLTDNGSTLGNVNLGEVSLLPPSLLLQYHFLPDERFQPYAGIGVNYTFFFDESAPRSTVQSIDYENAFGYVFQVGMDYRIDGDWYFNIDAKKLFLNTDVKINGGAITGDVDLDPWLVGFGVGYRFRL